MFTLSASVCFDVRLSHASLAAPTLLHLHFGFVNFFSLSHSLSLQGVNGTFYIKTNPHVHSVHSAVHVLLDRGSTWSVSNVRMLFIQHYNVSSSDNILR